MNLYPNNSSLLCKFSEFSDVEMWSARYRNDTVELKEFTGKKRVAENYADELERFHKEVEHDVLQTFEVLALFHETKGRCLKDELRKALKAVIAANAANCNDSHVSMAICID